MSTPSSAASRADGDAAGSGDRVGRLQTVCEKHNFRYWQLIDAFRALTGVPMVLNSSFNESEPIVCRPEAALDCFLRTKMDVLVMGCFFLQRS